MMGSIYGSDYLNIVGSGLSYDSFESRIFKKKKEDIDGYLKKEKINNVDMCVVFLHVIDGLCLYCLLF